MSVEHAFPFRTVSGFRPIEGLHIGHYGAVLRDVKAMQFARQGCSFVFIADHHSRSTWTERADFLNTHKRTTELATQLLAVGIDPEYSCIYRQSDIPEIFEFMWFLAGIATHGRLVRNPILVDAGEPTAGIYMYPLLMVADILSLRATNVVVGADQKIHVESARHIAKKLQSVFGKNFLPVPEYHRPEPIMLQGFKGRGKMDSTKKNDIKLFGDEDMIKDKMMKIVTTSVGYGNPLLTEGSVLLSYAEAIGGKPALDTFSSDFESGRYDYNDMKNKLIELFMDIVGPYREAHLSINPQDAEEILRLGGLRAREAVGNMIAEVRKHVGESF
jgi:tryptophanyl-tRNA synthetase